MKMLRLALLALLPGFVLGLMLPADAARRPAPDLPGDLNVYILLDRTGSMAGIWDEALNSVNAYAEELAAGDDGAVNVHISLAVFDAQSGLQFDMLRRNVHPADWRPVTSAEASPRGMTPLFDAIGAMLNVIDSDKPKRSVLVVMTDGLENASREMTRETVRARLDKAAKKGLETVFLGAEFGNFADASAVGVSGAKSMAVSKDGLQESMRRLSRKSRDYGAAPAAQAAPIEFDADDRAAAGEEDVKNRKPN